jgi:hypothetical protein
MRVDQLAQLHHFVIAELFTFFGLDDSVRGSSPELRPIRRYRSAISERLFLASTPQFKAMLPLLPDARWRGLPQHPAPHLRAE